MIETADARSEELSPQTARVGLVETVRNLADKPSMIDFSIPQAGLDRATTMVNQAASKIANLNTPGDSVDLSSEMVSLLQARNSFAANTKVIQTDDQLTKSLLDIIG